MLLSNNCLGGPNLLPVVLQRRFKTFYLLEFENVHYACLFVN